MSTQKARLYNWVTDKSNGVKITAARMDAEMDQVIVALNQKAIIKATAPSSPIEGMLWYDTTDNLLKCYTGASWVIVQVVGKGADVASAGTMTLGTDGNFFDITGTTGITSITIKDVGSIVYLQFDGVLTVTDGSNLKLAGDLVTAAGTTLTLISDGTNWWEIARSPGFIPTAANALTGSIVQSVFASSASKFTCDTAMPYDDSIPQNTEGNEILTLAITPKSATNKLIIMFSCTGAASAAQVITGCALFQDSTANALAVDWNESFSTSAENTKLLHSMVAGTTSETTFKIRIGPQANTYYVNADGSDNRRGGGVSLAQLVILEVKV